MSRRRPCSLVLLSVAALVALAMALAGRMQPWTTFDTPGWLDACGAAGCWAGPRTPVYGWLVGAITGGGRAMGALPWLHLGAFVAAAWWLMRGLLAVGASAAAALAVALALVSSNLVVLWTPALLPELFAHAAMLGAMAGALHLAARRPDVASAGLLAAAGGLAGAGYLLKPGLLLVAPLLAAMLLVLRPQRRAQAAALLGVALLPFLLVASLRLATLGDFNVVSFAGFQMSGMAALMLTPEVVARLPPELRDAASGIVARRDALVAAGAALPIPLNSHGERSFVSAASGYFDVLARTYDAVLYGAVAPGRGVGESWVAFDRRMERLAVATLAAAPFDYAAWVLGALTRLVGRAIVINLPFVLGCLGWLALARRRAVRAAPHDIRLLGLLTAVWTGGTALPTILLTFPAGRYIDSACLMLAAWPIFAVLRHLWPDEPILPSPLDYGGGMIRSDACIVRPGSLSI
jgi:hypothetical protein